MGLRHASVRHPNVVVMAPALTETPQSQSRARLPLALKKYKQKCTILSKNSSSAEPKSSSVRVLRRLNAPSPSKTTYSINGLAKTLKDEFLSINQSDAVNSNQSPRTSESSNDSESLNLISGTEEAEYCFTQIGGYIMNSSSPSSTDENQSTMGLQKSNQEIASTEANLALKEKGCTGEVDQLFKNLGVVMSNDDLTSTGELNTENVEEILQVITSMENNGGDLCEPEISQLESGPSVDTEGIFSISDGTLANFERELFHAVDVMNMCVDEGLVSMHKDTFHNDRIDDSTKRSFHLRRKYDFIQRRILKVVMRTLGKHACDEMTDFLEYKCRLVESSNRTKGYNSSINDVSDSEASETKFDRKGVSLPIMSLFMRQLEHASTQQANSVARANNNNKQCRYFGSGSASTNGGQLMSNGLRAGHPGSILPSLSKKMKVDIEEFGGELQSQLEMIQAGIDSDMTDSSSGGESCDEFVPYNNQYQHQVPINKRAAWKWAEERASIASKWTWLQAQMADLEYKIRQQNEIRKQLRNSKGAVRLAGSDSETLPSTSMAEQNGYSGGEESSGGGCESIGGCSRTRGIHRTFAKRKLVHIGGLHRQSKKLARTASIRCSCRPPLPPCALCTGRPDPTQPRDPLEVPPVNQRIALVDPGYHPVLSFPSDVSQSVHFDAIMKSSEWQSRAVRIPGKACSALTGAGGLGGVNNAVTRDTVAGGPADPELRRKKLNHLETSVHRSKAPTPNVVLSNNMGSQSYNKLKRKLVVRGRRKRKNTAMNFDRYRQRRKAQAAQGDSNENNRSGGVTAEEGGSYEALVPDNKSPVPSPTPGKDPKDRRKRENSYDIDNIVIPYSIAAATRPEKLNYKEILTPKWRRVKEDNTEGLVHKNGVVRRSSHDIEGEEDVSDEAVIVRHDRSEVEERKKFLSFLKLPNSGLGRGRGQKRTDSRAESSGANTPDPMSPGASREVGGDTDNGAVPMISPPATPQASCSGAENLTDVASTSSAVSIALPPRRRTISVSSRIDPPKSPLPSQDFEIIAPYEPRVFPLSLDSYQKMLSENEVDLNYGSVISNNNSQGYKPYELQSQASRPDSPSSFSTDSADSYVVEDPNDPEWTNSTVDRLPNKR